MRRTLEKVGGVPQEAGCLRRILPGCSIPLAYALHLADASLPRKEPGHSLPALAVSS